MPSYVIYTRPALFGSRIVGNLHKYRYICDNIYFAYTESAACSRQTNVGNSTEERIGRHLLASYPSSDIGVGLLLIYLQGFLRPV